MLSRSVTVEALKSHLSTLHVDSQFLVVITYYCKLYVFFFTAGYRKSIIGCVFHFVPVHSSFTEANPHSPGLPATAAPLGDTVKGTLYFMTDISYYSFNFSDYITAAECCFHFTLTL